MKHPKKKKVVRSRANADRTSAFSFCACAYILDMRPIQPVLHVIGLVDSNLPPWPNFPASQKFLTSWQLFL